MRTPRTDPEERGCAAHGVVAPRPPPAVRAHTRGKVGVSRGPRRREKPPAAHCLFPRPRGSSPAVSQGAAVERAIGERRAPRERPSPPSLRSSSSRPSSAAGSQASAASIALPAAATARHCAPSPARRGHMLRPRSPRPLGPAPAPPGHHRAARRARLVHPGHFAPWLTRKQELAQDTVWDLPLPSPPLQEWPDLGLKTRVEAHLARGKKPRLSVTTFSGSSPGPGYQHKTVTRVTWTIKRFHPAQSKLSEWIWDS
ncbi:uncharacterized protein LOC110330939 [Mus pahari]|uniref:uncharacterized protein LOC110330939 n=1 Tax=Mus pahari TaxID=10093 RepID=UPI000A30B171|nr:uncharacterized protein LOC110330939 [Mus pahari]